MQKVLKVIWAKSNMVAIILWLGLTATAQAEDFLSLGLGFATTTIRDPNTQTSTAQFWYPRLAYRHAWQRQHAFALDMGWARHRVRAQSDRAEIKGEVWMTGVRYLYRWPLAKYFHPHLHIGIESVFIQSATRFTLDQDGFLADRLPSIRYRRWNGLLGISYHLADYGWADVEFALVWHDPFGLSSGYSGGWRGYVQYSFRLN